VVAGRQYVPDHHSRQDLDPLAVRASGPDPGPEPNFERSEDPFDHRPPTVATSELPSMGPLIGHHGLPSREAVGPPAPDILAEVDHWPTSTIRDRLGIASGEVALVESDRAEGDLRGDLLEEGRELDGVVDVGIGDPGREEERELSSSGDERMELDEGMAMPGGHPGSDPSLVASGREAGAVPSKVLVGSTKRPSQLFDHPLEVFGRDTGHQSGDRRSGRDLSEPQTMGELGEGDQGRMGLDLRPAFEGSKEKETDHIPMVGGRTTRGTGRSNHEGRGKAADQPGQSIEDIRPTVPKEVAIAGPIDAPMA
jgi:hypothetical protein